MEYRRMTPSVQPAVIRDWRGLTPYAMPIANWPDFGTKKANAVAGRFAAGQTELYVTETVAEILDAYRNGAITPEDIVARALPASGPTTIRRFSSRCATRPRCWPRRGRLRRPVEPTLPLFRHPGRRQGQYRRRGSADHRRLSGLQLSPRPRRDSGGAAARSRRAHSRQDQSRSVRDRARRRAHALRHRPQSVRSEAHSRGLEHRLGARGRVPVSTPLALGTDTAGSGRVPAAFGNIVGLKPSRGLVSNAGVGAGLPHARLRFGLCADRRRCGDDAGRDCRRPMPADPYSRPRPSAAPGPDAGRSAARRAAAGPAAVLRRSRVGSRL